MIKVLVPEIAKEVGTTAALLLQHINYWMITQEKDKIFRTNNELVEDLNQMFSLFQIQYAKKKLVDNGFLIVSYDKKYDRTSHYTFTKKALDLLKPHTDYLLAKIKQKTQRKTNTQAFYGSYSTITGTTVPEQSNVAVKPPQMSSKGMAKCFEEQGKVRDNVVRGGMPDVLKRQIKSKVEEPKVEPIHFNEEDHEKIKLSDHLASESLNSLSVFKRIPNLDILEKQRMMKEQVLTYKEDW